MNLLVTGAAGFIGSTYVRTLLASDAPDAPRITVLDKLTYAGTLENLELDHPRLEFVQGDICDAELVDKLMAAADQVVHFAAESHVDRSINGAADFVRTNVVGTQVLLDAALRYRTPFVHISTDEVYGSIESGSWPETHPSRPTRRTPRRRRPPTCSPWPTTAPTAWTSASPAARTTTGRTSSPRRSSRCSSATSSTARRSPSTARASTSATGCTSRTTARASSWCAPRVAPARSTTSAAAPS